MMLQPQGYGVETGPDGIKEADSYTCFHCQRIVFVQPRCPPSDAGGWCGRCTRLICKRCVGKGSCTPWERQMERMEARDRALRSYGL
jgi:hypothetical protein